MNLQNNPSGPRAALARRARAANFTGRVWGAIALLWCALLANAAPVTTGVDSIGIPVRDLERAKQFYTQVLRFEFESEREVYGEQYERLFGVFGVRLRSARLRLGDERIELMEFVTPRGRPVPNDSRSNDRWFQHVAIVVSDMRKAYAHLRSHRVEHASTAPQRLPDWNPNAGGIEAFYFRDPDGNHLEIIYFPPGKGLEKWRRDAQARLFLGVDHTAIVVAETEASLRHYRDLLGLDLVGASENYGTEQEHLNNVFGARLRITTLRGARGPGVELLEYLAPRTGRGIPADTQATDHWYWQVNLLTNRLDVAARALRESGAVTRSIAPVALGSTELGFRAGLVALDPDGHASLLQEGRP
jgi:catechol 2,3-dioxygenase-like lactoylglutathione lyase family enzyme